MVESLQKKKKIKKHKNLLNFRRLPFENLVCIGNTPNIAFLQVFRQILIFFLTKTAAVYFANSNLCQFSWYRHKLCFLGIPIGASRLEKDSIFFFGFPNHRTSFLRLVTPQHAPSSPADTLQHAKVIFQKMGAKTKNDRKKRTLRAWRFCSWQPSRDQSNAMAFRQHQHPK